MVLAILAAAGGQIRVTTNLTYQQKTSKIGLGVTGQSELENTVASVLEPRLMSVLMARAAAQEILRSITEKGLVIVPRKPTQEMLEAGWYYANDEDAAGTWDSMIEAYGESSGNSVRGNG